MASFGLADLLQGRNPLLTTMPPPDTRRNPLLQPVLFGGEGSATANREALERARGMGGADRTRVWRDTGWFRGDDGRWRYEISDAGARYVPPPSGHTSTTLGQILHHPDLYRAYPDIANVPVTLGLPFLAPRGAGGSYRPPFPFGERIHLPIAGNDVPENILSRLIHETQHALQRRERTLSYSDNFTRGYEDRPNENEAYEVQNRLFRNPDALRNVAPYSPSGFMDYGLERLREQWRLEDAAAGRTRQLPE